VSEDSTFKAGGDPTATMSSPGGEAPVIGHYRLLQMIGEGGMGEVWEAEQTEPVHRRVALKLIKRGMDSAEVIARFESERQALALMDHPTIAKVFDAGTTAGGRPFFVMEHVRGVRITEYCDRHRMTVRQRLELFIQVCEGIQHAHQKAIIHRDIKPSNILTAGLDGVPIPKIIDFGVAKATAQRLTERTLYTELGQLIGTPEYMSPEQAELTGEDIDIRTDVYSLGMVLYELLVGALPFDPKELRHAGLLELQRKIREDEPAKPSTQITRMGDSSTLAAKARRTTPAALARNLRGDLDWIVLKALDKDRNRRYDTARALALDIGRFLADEAIEARPPSTLYRFKKFVKRHTLGVAVSFLVAFSLVTLALLMTVQSIRIAHERDRAASEAAKAEAVVEFLQETLGSADPYEGRGREITVTQVLEHAADEVDTSFAGEPLTRAAVRQTIGVTYSRLGRYPEAESLLRQSLETRRQILGSHHADVAESLGYLAWLRTARGDYTEAESLYREALEIWEGESGDVRAQSAEALNGLGEALYGSGRYADAAELFREAIELRRQAFGNDSDEVANSKNDLAMSLARQGQYEEAEPLYLDVLATRKRLYTQDHPSLAQTLNNTGMFYFRSGDSVSAEPYLRQSLEMNRRLLGDKHPEVSTSLNNIGLVLMDRGDYDGAASKFREVLALDTELLGEQHPYVAGTLRSLGDALMHSGALGEAETLLREAEQRYGVALDEGHWQVSNTQSFIGECLQLQGRYVEAEALLLAAHHALAAQLGPDHRRTQRALGRIVELYNAWGKPAEAAEYRARLASD